MNKQHRQEAVRDMLKLHHEELLERAKHYEWMANACRSVVERERSLFADLWGDRMEGCAAR